MKLLTLKSPEEASQLEAFLMAHPYGRIEQSFVWGKLQTSLPDRPCFFVLAVEEAGELIASVLLIRQVMGFKKSWLWGPGGPILPTDLVRAKAAWKILRKGILDLAREGGDVFVRLEPGTPKGEGIDLGGKISKECYLPRFTLVLPLAAGPEALLAQMKQKGRYNIRQAEKQGVHVRLLSSEEVQPFISILKETALRDGFHIHEPAFYGRFLSTLGPLACVYGAFLGERPLAALWASFFGKTATYYYGASSSTDRELMAPYALQWHAMQEGIARGCTEYDLLGIADPENPNDSLASVTQFKTRFGGKMVQYESAQVFVLRPFWWWVRGVVRKLRG